jgi:hypothetical protein
LEGVDSPGLSYIISSNLASVDLRGLRRSSALVQRMEWKMPESGRSVNIVDAALLGLVTLFTMLLSGVVG